MDKATPDYYYGQGHTGLLTMDKLISPNLNDANSQIGQFHVSENILITFLIVVTSRLDAVVAHKNVLQPMRIRRSTVIKRSSRMNYMV